MGHRVLTAFVFQCLFCLGHGVVNVWLPCWKGFSFQLAIGALLSLVCPLRPIARRVSGAVVMRHQWMAGSVFWTGSLTVGPAQLFFSRMGWHMRKNRAVSTKTLRACTKRRALKERNYSERCLEYRRWTRLRFGAGVVWRRVLGDGKRATHSIASTCQEHWNTYPKIEDQYGTIPRHPIESLNIWKLARLFELLLVRERGCVQIALRCPRKENRYFSVKPLN